MTQKIADLQVPIDSVQPHPHNPRVGNVEQIATSLKVNGQYRAIVVNERDRTILAGNHTWKAAKSLGWESIAVTYVDATDEEAERIMLADNRLAELGTYDEDELAALLQGAGPEGLVGTGWTEDDLALLVSHGQTENPESPWSPFGHVIAYNIVFDDEAQQVVWFEFLRWLRNRYPDMETASGRLAVYLQEVMDGA